MIISAIVAVAHKNVIGHQNDIPWNMPRDMRYFMNTTKGHHIIMGRKNYESIGRPLPKRTNIIVTRNPFYISSGCVVVHSLEEALYTAKVNGEEEVFIIGGGMIYQQSMDYLDKIYLTEIDLKVPGDVFFPEINQDEWQLVSEEFFAADEKNAADMIFKVFQRPGNR